MADSSSPEFIPPTTEHARNERLMSWPFNLKSYSPASTFGKDVAAKLSDFEESHLSKESSVQCIRYTKSHSVEEYVLTDEHSEKFSTRNDESLHEIFFINRSIVRPGATNPPEDIGRLKISKIAFRSLLSTYEIPPEFVSFMMTPGFASLPFQHRRLALPEGKALRIFYIIPVRVGLQCADDSRSHLLSSSANLVNSSEYLHLSDAGRDIRPSKIAVFSQHNEETHQTVTICIDFQDGVGNDLTAEPLLRTKEVLENAKRTRKIESPFFFHLLLLTSVAEWWRQALALYNAQLIACERNFQLQVYLLQPTPDKFIDKTSTALHIMIAHLQQYKTETSLLVEVATSLSAYSKCTCQTHSMQDAYFDGIASELKVIRVAVSELGSKTKTIIGLLFNNMRSASDRLQVAHGEAMRQLLAATSAEAKLSRKLARQSQKMAMDMRRDSTSMKTIAIMTMFFLPATSFAAILSMPFFAQSPWMGRIDRAWLWAALSVSSTGVAFAVFYMCTRRGDREIERNRDIELDSVEGQA